MATALAAIDVGSNAIRLVIGELDRYGEVHVVKKVREPVRLGKDVFASGEISAKTRERAVESFVKFKEMMKEHGVTQSDLPELGSQGVVSEILHGRRELNTRHIKALSKRFGISPAAFF